MVRAEREVTSTEIVVWVETWPVELVAVVDMAPVVPHLSQLRPGQDITILRTPTSRDLLLITVCWTCQITTVCWATPWVEWAPGEAVWAALVSDNSYNHVMTRLLTITMLQIVACQSVSRVGQLAVLVLLVRRVVPSSWVTTWVTCHLVTLVTTISHDIPDRR